MPSCPNLICKSEKAIYKYGFDYNAQQAYKRIYCPKCGYTGRRIYYKPRKRLGRGKGK